MNAIRKVIKIFLASPGDLKDERVAARDVVTEFNQTWADILGYQIELVGWEDTVSAFGRPQELINRELDQCELFFGMMWKRWGTKPSKSGTYTSGFEEEFETSLNKCRLMQKPEMRMVFKDVDEELLRDPGAELSKVVAFKQKIIDEKEILFESFSNISDFIAIFRRSISRYVQQISVADKDDIGKSKTKTTAKTLSNKPLSEESLANKNEISFIKEFTDKLVTPEQITATDTARFRLISVTNARGGNDEIFIGVHDANLIFRNSSNADLSRTEIFGIIESGLDKFSSETIPFWHWFKIVNGFDKNYLSLFTFNASDRVKSGALDALTLLGEPLHTVSKLKRRDYLEIWFEEKAASSVKISALKYLSYFGESEDVALVEKEISRNDISTRSAAIETHIRMILRQSRSDALAKLNFYQPETIKDSILRDIFKNASLLSCEEISKGLDNRNNSIRYECLVASRSNGIDNREKLTNLLTDSHARIRYESLMQLELLGSLFSESDVKSILVKAPEPGLSGIARPDFEGDSNFNNYLIMRLKELSFDELTVRVTGKSLFSDNEYLAILDKYFDRRSDMAASDVENRFEKFIDQQIERYLKDVGPAAAKSILDLRTYLRERILEKTIDIFAKKDNPKYINLIRSAAQLDHVRWNDNIAKYISKHGEWTDISIIAQLASRPNYSNPFLYQMYSQNSKSIAAKAIAKLVGDKVPDLVGSGIDLNLLSFVVLNLSNRLFVDLADDKLLKLLNSDNDNLRKVTALRIIQNHKITTIRRIRDIYIKEVSYYYNVLYWLDFGLSLDKARLNRALKRELASMNEN